MKNLTKIFVGVAYVVMIGVNFLSNALPINGVTAGEVSDSFPNLFAPAGVTFAIWGLIYALLGAYTIFQFGYFPKKDSERESLDPKVADSVRVYFILSSVANALWVFAWHYKIIWVSLILIVVMLFSLIRIALLLHEKKLTKYETALIRIPFSVYFGWITVATIANVTILLVSVNWNGFGLADQVWMILILLVATIIGLAQILWDKNIAYGLVFLWAYFGIWVKHSSVEGFNGQYPNVIAMIQACLVVLLTSIVYVGVKKKGK